MIQISVCRLSSTLAKAFRLCFNTEFTFSEHQSKHETRIILPLLVYHTSISSSNPSLVFFTSNSCFPTISSLFLCYSLVYIHAVFSSYTKFLLFVTNRPCFLIPPKFWPYYSLRLECPFIGWPLGTSGTFNCTSKLNSSITPLGRLSLSSPHWIKFSLKYLFS